MNIPVSFVFDEAAMGAAQKWHWRQQAWVRWFFPVFGVLNIVLGVRAVQDPDALDLAIMFFIVGPCCLLLPWILVIQHRRNIRKSPYYGKTVSWQIEEHQMSAVTEGAAWSLTWDKILNSIATPEGLLAYTHKNMYYWFPKTAFRSDQDYEDVKRIIARSTKHRELT